jgi:hypothetical protein
MGLLTRPQVFDPGHQVAGIGLAPQAGSEEQRLAQLRALKQVEQVVEVEIEHVDRDLGLTEAVVIASGRSVVLNRTTEGASLEALQVGDRLLAHLTRCGHAVKVESLPR